MTARLLAALASPLLWVAARADAVVTRWANQTAIEED
jgi:hypothetical protein